MTTEIENFENEFLSDSDFFETVLYTPDGEAERSIPAIIFRNKFKEKKQFGDRGVQSMAYLYDYEMRISRGADNGIPVITIGKDTVKIPIDISDSVLSTFNVQAVTMQDKGSFRLGLKK